MVHTILGAGGPVSNALWKELEFEGESVRLVSRRKIETAGNTSWMEGDLLNGERINEAVKGSSVVYLCAGLRYDKKVWAHEWPLIIKNVIHACKNAGSRLIFFDNVYMYGKVNGEMKEETLNSPLSVKGEIRAKVADVLMNEFGSGRLKGSIARAADFYGAPSLNSFYDGMVLAKYSKNQKALWLGNPATLHSFTYVPDAGKAMALLGNEASSDGQIWHLPSAKALSGHEFIRLAAENFDVKPNFMRVNKFMLNSLGLFQKMMEETAEMYYQYQYDYIFNSTKFEKAFGVSPTSYVKGIADFGMHLNKETD